ncbi:hypothetical protein Dxin01_03465 [Deinococcus xinjiangensis]|uniref:Uncharacterized protein n=1 Tax=Deinococcus xinjiangensis TaxID=457454 RepID=A0ABP9VEQ2_9DEIO
MTTRKTYTAEFNRYGEVAGRCTGSSTLAQGVQVLSQNGRRWENATLQERSVVMSSNRNYFIHNALGTSLPSLNSHFTCIRTGEQVTATLDLEGAYMPIEVHKFFM